MEVLSPCFEARATYDQPAIREVTRAYPLFLGRYILFRCILAAALLYSICLQLSFLQADFFFSCLYLVLGIFLIGLEVFQYLRSRDGGITYKRILSGNNGIPPRHQLLFCEDAIHCTNADTQNRHVFRYEQLRSVGKTKHLLIFFLEYNQYFLVDRDCLANGAEEALLQYLIRQCPKLKPKKLRKCRAGRAVTAICRVLTCVTILVSVCCLEPVQNLIEQSRPINNTMSVSEIARELSGFDITVPAEDIQELETYYREYEVDPYYGFQPDKRIDLLSWAGYGEYDETTWEWTPTQNGVFWLDFEVADVSVMYTDLLRGVSALCSEELDFTNIRETVGGVDPAGGTHTVEFSWDGVSHSLEGQNYYDWLDARVINDLSSIVKSHDTGKRLYFASDGGQGCLIFYREPAWARAFTRATGIRLVSQVPLSWF